MPDIPEEAVQAAADALNNAHGQHEYAGACPVCCSDDETVIRIALEAAAPVLVAQVRRETAAQIAAAIEARRCPAERKFCDACVCRPEDAALARKIGADH
jgi:hypothetical protein